MTKTATISNNQLPYIVAFLLLFILMATGFAIAGEKGRVEFNGRTVILNDDNTWKFEDNSRQVAADEKNADEEKSSAADTPDCQRISSSVVPVSVCLDDKIWQLGEKSDAAEFSFNTKNDKLFLLIITEKEEVQLDAFEKAIVSNAQKAAGLNPVEVVVKERINALGLDWGRMVYIANIDGLIIQYENFFTMIKGKGSVQYVFYAIPEDYKALASEIEKVTSQIDVN